MSVLRLEELSAPALDALDRSRTLAVVGRVASAGAVASGAAFAVWYGLDELLGRELLGQLVSLGAALAAAALVYLGLARALGLRELEALLLLRSRRDEPSDER